MLRRGAALLLLPLLLLCGRAAGRPSSGQYLRNRCAAYDTTHGPLVDAYLAQYPGGFSVADVLAVPEGYNGSRLAREFPGGATPILYVIDGRLRADASLPAPGGKVLKNLEYFGLPVLGQLAAAARLPDLALRYSPYDEADLGGGGRQLPGGSDAAPWFGYCGQRAQRRALLLPDDLLPAGVQCPLGGCQAGPGDAREPRAVFLGSPTGWAKGKRRAVLLAGLAHPEAVHAGLTEDPDQLLTPEEAELFGRAPFMELADQVARFKYAAVVEGNCAALRLKRLLGSPSAVLLVQSDEAEWFTPLLVPWVHYIPVGFVADARPQQGGEQGGSPQAGGPRVDLTEKVAWAEAHPEDVARIVSHANAFAAAHLSRAGQTCFAMRVVHGYAALLADPWAVRKLRHRTRDTE